MDNYGTYGALGSNYGTTSYSQNVDGYQSHFDYTNFPDFPINTSTAPSINSESPPPIRRGSIIHNQPPPLQSANHLPSTVGYDEFDATFQYSSNQYSQGTNQSSNGYLLQSQPSPNGYASGAGKPIQAQSSHSSLGIQSSNNSATYNPYELHPPQGYLDNRPCYDDHGQYQTGPLRGPPPRPLGCSEEDFNLTEGSSVCSVGGVKWRDPDLHEVIEFLSHPNPAIRSNAAAHLQHLCFSDDNIKQKARALGAIPVLINLLNQDSLEVLRNACGALRNLSYGRRNDENKKMIQNSGGILCLVNLLRSCNDNELKELITSVLWNLSSCEPLKKPIIDDSLTILVTHIIIPLSGWKYPLNEPTYNSSGSLLQSSSGPLEMYWSTVFRNASGVLRNVSSAGEYARKKLRSCEGLIDSLMYLIRAAISKNDIDNKSVENCVCILRNLSYRCQEIIDPEYDKQVPHHGFHSSSSSSRAVAIMGSVGSKVGDNLGCFGVSKKKSKENILSNPSETRSLTQATQQLSLNSNAPLPGLNRRPTDPIIGMELLWQPEVVQPYLAILSECSNPETLEAAAGAIQNLAACYWQPSIDIRAAVRKEKGLPVFVELLRMEVDRVVCAVATALRNLALDQRNKELIGKYAMRDLVSKLPNGNHQHDSGTSDDTIAAVLATLNEVVLKNADFAKSLLEADGMEKLLYIVKNKSKFSSRVFKFTSQVSKKKLIIQVFVILSTNLNDFII